MYGNVEELLKFLEQLDVVLQTWWWQKHHHVCPSFLLLRYVLAVYCSNISYALSAMDAVLWGQLPFSSKG